MEEMYGLFSSGIYQNPPAPARDNYTQSFESQEVRDHRIIPPAVFESGQMIFSAASKTPVQTSNANITTGGSAEELERDLSDANRAKIMSHPLYPKLLHAYIACQKVGAPPDIANLFDEIFRENDLCCRRSAASSSSSSSFGDDPELDEFMETYCEVLNKYRSDLARPFDEATRFLNNIQTQLTDLCDANSRAYHLPDEDAHQSEEDLSTGEVEAQESDWTSEDRALKDRLLCRYSKYISSLKHEFSNKKKKGKLPKEARQALLDWWNVHYKWPYPTEADKIALTEATGLDQKQINNWFINQRKRHWKPSENMQFAVMDSLCGSFFINN